jgi:hypothetical protein
MFMRKARQTCRLRFLKHIACQNKITYLKMKNCRFLRDEHEYKRYAKEAPPVKVFYYGRRQITN